MAEEQPFAQLCREFGIAPKNGRKWVKRFWEEGASGLQDRSRRPHSNPAAVDTEMALEICRIRSKNNWGCGKNIRPVLLRSYAAEQVPSPRTIDRILAAAGLVEPRKKRRANPVGERLKTGFKAEHPNDVWTTDFKGWWFTQDRRKCQPLTLRDDFSRYLLTIQGMRQIRWEAVQEAMCEAFEAYGLPAVIRSDNGSPFACGHSLLGLTRLSAWWVAQGIRLDRIEPGHPEQNGGHERMHKDLKRQLQRVPELDLVAQQVAFDEWRTHFNEVRPHSALSMQTPSEVYLPSPRRFRKVQEIVYPKRYEVHKVDHSGWIKRRKTRMFLSTALAGWHVGIEHHEDGTMLLWFAELPLGVTDKDFVKLRQEE